MKGIGRKHDAGWVLVVLAVVLVATTGQGYCDSEPEPLQNRSSQQAPASAPSGGDGKGTADGAPAVTVTGTGGNQDATVVVTPPVVVVPQAGAVVPGQDGPAAPGGSKAGGPVPAGPGLAKDVPAVPGGPVIPTTPSAPVVPLGQDGGKGNAILPDKVKGKDGAKLPDVQVTGKGGDQHTKVLVTPQGPAQAVPLVPGKAGNGPGNVTPDNGKVSPPVAVPQGGYAVDAAGHPVNAPAGQEVVLPHGGKVVDAQGNAIPVPPGGRVVVPARAMTPGDFLPKDGKSAQDKKDGSDQQKDGAPKKQGKPQARLVPDRDGRVKGEKPPGNTGQVDNAELPVAGARIKIPENACRKHTVDFLAGCWRGQVVLQDRTPVTIQFCFDAAGKGKRIDINKRRNEKCVSSMNAKWQGDSLSFSFGPFYCSSGRLAHDVPIICNGCGDNTRCVGTEYRGEQPVGKTKFEIIRE